MKDLSAQEQSEGQSDDAYTEIVEEIIDSFPIEKTSDRPDSQGATKDVESIIDSLAASDMDPNTSAAAAFLSRGVALEELASPVTGQNNMSGAKDSSVEESPSTANQSGLADGIKEVVKRLDDLNKEVRWVTNKIREENDESENEDAYEEEKADVKSPTDINLEEHGDNVDQGEEEVERDPGEDGIGYQVEFRDSIGTLLERQKWRNLVNLRVLSKGNAFITGKTIALITTAMRTNHDGDRERSEGKKKRIVKAGFLNNPRVEIRSVRQSMSLKSRAVIAALQKLVKYYPSITLTAQGLTLESPYCILVHHMADLEAFRLTYKPPPLEDGSVAKPNAAHEANDTGDCSEVAFRHIGKMISFLNGHIHGQQLRDEQACYLQDAPVCTFSMLWLLYKPGTTVYVNTDGMVEAYVVESFKSDNTLYSAQDMALIVPRPSHLMLWHLSFDGVHIRRSSRSEIIGAFDGERPIGDLKAVPAEFADKADGGKMREQLIQYGKRWYSLLHGAQQQHYFGDTMGSPKRHIDTRVVIDIDSYSRIEDIARAAAAVDTDPDRKTDDARHQMGNFKVDDTGEDRAPCPCERCCMKRPHPPRGFPWAEYDMMNPALEKSLELPEGYDDRQHRYLLCTRRLMGFALKSRTWEKLDVACCQPPRINVHAIDTLVMPEERKRLIKAIVQKYRDPGFTPGKSNQTWGADFIQSKGEGQIFLLHGGPGVGKTYVKCISELIGRPLLSLTCADFGTDEIKMEKNLSKWFLLAESWGAVMLLDEADVWLERRMISDLKRNTLVAVFLRCLEYYRGILFLTSNRVGTFDDAFISRIHVVIYYEDLGEEQRKQIWKHFFDKLERERKDTIIVESRAKHFVLSDSEMRKVPWNGREIRNAFQTAVSLAEYRFHFEGGKTESDMIVLDKVDFEQVCQMSIEFKRYLDAVHGGDENDRAMRHRNRA